MSAKARVTLKQVKLALKERTHSYWSSSLHVQTYRGGNWVLEWATRHRGAAEKRAKQTRTTSRVVDIREEVVDQANALLNTNDAFPNAEPITPIGAIDAVLNDMENAWDTQAEIRFESTHS